MERGKRKGIVSLTQQNISGGPKSEGSLGLGDGYGRRIRRGDCQHLPTPAVDRDHLVQLGKLLIRRRGPEVLQTASIEADQRL